MSAPMGDSKKFFAIKKVNDYLIKGNKVVDDTVLHSLFDSIKRNFCSLDAIEDVGLGKFVEDVAKNCTELDSCAVVFGLELAGWLGGSYVFYRHFKGSIQHVFYTVWEKLKSESLCDISITTALYDSLTLITQQEDGLLWIVHDKKMEDITSYGLKYLTNCPSIFLEKAVVKYLSSVIIELEGKKEVSISEQCQTFSSRILRAATENIKKQCSEKRVGPFVPSSLQLLETLCRHSEGTSIFLLTNHIEFCYFLLEMIGSLNARDCDAVINILSAVLKMRTEVEKTLSTEELITSIIQNIENKLADLASEKNIVTAQKLATCCLQTVHSKRLQDNCTAILIQPILWILGDTVQQLIFPEHILKESLSTRCKCTDAVCRSLNTNVIDSSHVVELLRRTIEYSTCGGESYTKAASFLYKNRKIQRKCLEVLNLDTQSNGCSLLKKAQIVVDLFKEPDSDTVIYSLCSQLLCAWLPTLVLDVNSISLTTSLAETIQFHLSALQWELRDTTLELLGKIIQQHTENQNVSQWIVDHRLHVQIWQCVQDGESYVRASAISALYQLCQSSQLLIALFHTGLVSDKNAIIEIISNVVENDTEAFARRSAVIFLLNILKAKVISDTVASLDAITDHFVATVITATRDFDWEVKLNALNCIALLLQHEISECCDSENKTSECQQVPQITMIGRNLNEMPDHLQKLYKSYIRYNMKLNKSKFNCRPVVKDLMTALISALDDYDEKVSEKALKIFAKTQKYINKLIVKCQHEKAEQENNCEPTFKKRKLTVIDEKVTTGTNTLSELNVHIPIDLNKVPECDENSEHLNEACCSESDENETRVETEAVALAGNLKMILDLDLSLYESRVEQVLDEASKLVSLVEDIVTANDNNDDEENAVDCY